MIIKTQIKIATILILLVSIVSCTSDDSQTNDEKTKVHIKSIKYEENSNGIDREFSYENKKLTKIISTSNNDKTESNIQYKDDRPVLIEFYENQKSIGSDKILYENGEISKIESYNSSNSLTRFKEFSYEGNKLKTISEYSVITPNTPEKSIELTLSYNGDLISTIETKEFYSNGNFEKSEVSYTYDTKNHFFKNLNEHLKNYFNVTFNSICPNNVTSDSDSTTTYEYLENDYPSTFTYKSGNFTTKGKFEYYEF